MGFSLLRRAGVLFFLLTLPTALARQTSFQFQHIEIPGGPNENLVVAVTQDRHGAMWFATHGGLFRYDGYAFTAYRHDVTDSTSISHTRIETLLAARDGTLWIGTFGGGLNRYNESSDSFTRYRHDPTNPTTLSQDTVTVIRESPDGHLWIGTFSRGLDRFDPESGRFTRFRHDLSDPTSIPSDYLRSLYVEPGGTLWAGFCESSRFGDRGIGRLDPETGEWSRFNVSTPSGEIEPCATAVFERRDGIVLVGYDDNRLAAFEPTNGTFQEVAYVPRGPTEMDWQRGSVRFFHENREGGLWMGVYGAGLAYLRPGTDSWQFFPAGAESAVRLTRSSVWDAGPSSDGILWIATWDGVFKADPSGDPIVRFSGETDAFDRDVASLLEDRTGELWIGTFGHGLVRRDPVSGASTRFVTRPGDNTSLAFNTARSLLQDRDGSIWFGSGAYLQSLDPTTGRVRRYTASPEVPAASVSSRTAYVMSPGFSYTPLGDLRSLVQDEDGWIWIGFGGPGQPGALVRFDPASERFLLYRHDPADPASLAFFQVNVVEPRRAGGLWIGTFGRGVDRLDPDTGTFEHLPADPRDPNSLSDRWITALHEDAAGHLWIGSRYGGLDRKDGKSGVIERWSGKGKPLPTVEIHGIAEAPDGAIWLTTWSALIRLDPVTRATRFYDARTDLQIGRLNGQTLVATEDGRLLFGGDLGYGMVLPTGGGSQGPETVAPSVMLTGLSLFGERIEPSDSGFLTAPVWNTDRVHLPYDQNVVTIDFVGMHYENPADITYAVRLDGLDDDWQDRGRERSVTYTGLRPGTYVFRMRAANPAGVWSEPTSPLTLVIRPPWWRTWTAYLLYGLALVLGVFGVDRVQRRRLIRRERDHTRERELAQAREIEKAYAQLKSTQAQLVQQEKLASLGQLTAGIAHEIKNPLNFINNFAQLNAELASELREAVERGADVKDLAAMLGDNAERISEHGQRADRIVRSMMAHAGRGTGARELVSVNQLVSEYVDLAYHGRRAREEAFDVSVERDFDDTVGSVEMVPQDIGRVVLNLLDNAFDAVSAGTPGDRAESSDEALLQAGEAHHPTVTVSTRKTDAGAEIRIRDNGNGIPAAVRDRLFEPFFTTKPTGSGTGLGLSLSHDIVTEGHGGRLEVDSEEGHGATFIVLLPYPANPDGMDVDG